MRGLEQSFRVGPAFELPTIRVVDEAVAREWLLDFVNHDGDGERAKPKRQGHPTLFAVGEV